MSEPPALDATLHVLDVAAKLIAVLAAAVVTPLYRQMRSAIRAAAAGVRGEVAAIRVDLHRLTTAVTNLTVAAGVLNQWRDDHMALDEERHRTMREEMDRQREHVDELRNQVQAHLERRNGPAT